MSRSLFIITLVFACLSSAAQETEGWGYVSSSYTFLGFSDDGTYAAYRMEEEMLHKQDKTLVQLFVVNVDKNDYAGRPFRFEVDSASTPKFTRASDSVNNVVKTRFHVTGAKRGVAIDFAAPVVIDSVTTSHAFRIGQRWDNIIIKQIPVKGSDDYGMQEVMVQVDLVSNGIKKTLQTAQRAPRSWGRTDHYSLIGGWVYNNKIALFLTYETAGFEGPGMRHQMIVTGTW